ncbi:NUDIX hydrolase [Amycolatopsis taiwanensis]|uniref:NUDIX hydrolase n=1 Tax=Amycolatopsis taiwanensis TaxID=342230 RepID=A0A9W6VHZ7_9PSEU|nr:NUDIX hydrolase [Amycolatopsis taiwanensis]GLY66981.1 NUDIX hydrolase [Amycolatopsis taiwanensis]
MRKERSGETRAAGALLWRETRDGVRIAVVHRPAYDDWSLPKGKLDPGETLPEAAVRELAEETGYRATLGRRLRTVRYPVADGTKTVVFFSAAAGAGAFSPNGEVDELRWLSPHEAETMLSYGTDVDVVRSFTLLPASLTTLLLVRHAKAGKRDEWGGEDDLRPLSPAGLRQAQGVRKLAPLFGVDRVFSAPPLRCRQTVEGIVTDLGVQIGLEPALSERGYLADPARGRSRLSAIVAAGGTPLVCSQGGVIPDVVGLLARRAGIELPTGKGDALPCKKGSVWVLSFRPAADNGGPLLAAADYYPSALPSPTPVRR